MKEGSPEAATSETPSSITTPIGITGNKYIGSTPSEYFEGKTFIPKWLADQLMETYTFKTMLDTDEIMVYRNGVYANDGASVIEGAAQQRLGSKSTTHRVNETVAHIQRATRIPRTEFDQDPNVINLENGLYHIDEEHLYPHTKQYLSTYQSPIKFDPSAKCPTIFKFLNDVLQPQDVLFMIEMFGYSLMIKKRMNTALFLEGKGRNGKSTFLELLTAFVGVHLCSEVAPSQMGSDDRFAIADLCGKLVNKIDDLGDLTLRDLGKFKTVVASKSVRGERKFEGSFSFVPHVLCVFACNDVPQTNDMSEGFFSRIRVIPFLKHFYGGNEKIDLIDELTISSEMSGLFNIAIKSAKNAIEKNEFAGGKSVADKQQEYMYASNPVARFIDDLCDATDQDAYISKDELYNQYILWSRDNGFKTKSKGTMTQYLEALGIMVRQITTNGDRVRVYVGIDIKGYTSVIT